MKLKSSRDEKLSTISDFSEKLQSEKLIARNLKLENQKLKLEKEYFEKELCQHKENLTSTKNLLTRHQKGEQKSLTSLKERELEIESLKKKIREMVMQSEEELRTERRKGEEERRVLKKGHEELQGNYFKLFEEHSKVYGKLKGLEKEHECSLVRLNDEKKTLEEKEREVRKKLSSKGLISINYIFQSIFKSIN